jgi:hypothetical protein
VAAAIQRRHRPSVRRDGQRHAERRSQLPALCAAVRFENGIRAAIRDRLRIGAATRCSGCTGSSHPCTSRTRIARSSATGASTQRFGLGFQCVEGGTHRGAAAPHGGTSRRYEQPGPGPTPRHARRRTTSIEGAWLTQRPSGPARPSRTGALPRGREKAEWGRAERRACRQSSRSRCRAAS